MANFEVLNGKTISFIGGGNMARAIIDGLLKAKQDNKLDLCLCVSDNNEDKRHAFASKGVEAVTPDKSPSIISKADVVVLAVKPQVMRQVATTVAPYLTNQLVLSVAAGLSVATLSQMLGDYQQIVRCMPNLPASKGFGASGLFADNASEKDRAMAQAVMQASGMVSWVTDEALLHAVTAVAGSAPAYFFYVLEHMIDKAVQMGLERADAQALAVQSMQGAAVLAQDNNPAVLREQVTSKGGTTAAALASLYEHKVGEAFAEAMQACSDRSAELGHMLSQS
ncbi:pyrroline-5-carboxylate reductase [Moraxella cuniculi DSM 21768]|uniref:Pyrroline-5-carboxylate reductase n=1 Tax=Moraxella cuniculi DSM 21768 TaxID=1122245 RepID=A0A1N7EE59_9GAMM|nr:pyrroline-5-carboxylate reductase [Moraxella cuniculi]OOS05301.1 pyrroline-5-carboxylate reductase [Moraxella cuniculi]SIR86381.1 pyrroline-5-carboxylate reductase [Moraxella cuniculi DSM 21768]